MPDKVRYCPTRISDPTPRKCSARGCKKVLPPRFLLYAFILSRQRGRLACTPVRTYERVFCCREHQLGWFRRVVLHEKGTRA